MDWNCLINIRSSLLSGQGKLQCLLLGIHWTQLSSCITRDTNQEWNNAPIIFFILASCRNIANVKIAKMIFKNELKPCYVRISFYVFKIFWKLLFYYFFICVAPWALKMREQRQESMTQTPGSDQNQASWLKLKTDSPIKRMSWSTWHSR